MKEEPRGHGKTVESAILMAWHGGRDPTLRQKIIGSNDTEAIKTAKFIRREIESDLYQEVFPWAALDPKESAAESFRYLNAGNSRDPSYEARGVFGRAGGRADRLWADDLSDLRNAILQPAMRARVKEAWANTWLPMLDVGSQQPERLSVWVTGTPWHIDDFTMDQRRKHEAAGTLFRAPCVGLVSPWPEAFTAEILAEYRKELGPTGYARAFELVPLSDDMLVFQPEWIRLWTELPPQARLTTIAAVDFAYTAKTTGKDDPDWSVCIVAEIGLDGMVFLTDIVRMRAAFPVFRDAVTQMLAQRKVTRCYAEANGPQRGVADTLAEHTRIPIIPMERHTDAMVRATQEQSYIAKGCLHFPSQDGQVRPDFAPLRDEMLTFPAGSHDDCLSACLDIVCAARTGDGQRRMTKPVYTDSPFEHTGPSGGWR